MQKQFCVLHITPYKTLKRIGQHIDRQCLQPNIDPQRTHLNEELASKATEELHKAVQKRILQAYTAPKKIRKDARRALGVILSGSHLRMKQIEADPQLFEAWKQRNYRFACHHFGKENIVRFTVHRDEKTPHIHCVFVPITPDGRLSAKDFVGSKQQLSRYQDDYAQAMAPLGLERGLPAAITQARHLTTHDFYRQVQAMEETVKQQVEEISLSNAFRLTEVRETLKTTLLHLHQRLWQQKTQNERLTRDYTQEIQKWYPYLGQSAKVCYFTLKRSKYHD